MSNSFWRGKFTLAFFSAKCANVSSKIWRKKCSKINRLKEKRPNVFARNVSEIVVVSVNISENEYKQASNARMK